MDNNLGKYVVFLTFGLKNTYRQIKLKESDSSFRVINAIPDYQQQMDKLVQQENYLDNITVAGHTQQEYDENVQVRRR